MVPALRLNLG